jgi:hypothetical protein
MLTVREFYDALNRCTSHGWLDWAEAILLVAAAEETSGRIVEIGSYMGRSAILLGQLTSMSYEHIQGGQKSVKLPREVLCVDPWDDKFSTDMAGQTIYLKFLANTHWLPNVVPIRSRVEDWKPVSAGFVYCDGDHSYDGTVHQLKKALECKPSAIAVHDVCSAGGGLLVQEAALSVLGRWSEKEGKMAVWKIKR